VPGCWLSTASVRQEAGPWVATVTVENRGSGHIAVEVATVKGERFPERTEEEATKGPAQPAPDYREARTTVVLWAGAGRRCQGTGWPGATGEEPLHEHTMERLTHRNRGEGCDSGATNPSRSITACSTAEPHLALTRLSPFLTNSHWEAALQQLGLPVGRPEW
jgi:hypothetical protein